MNYLYLRNVHVGILVQGCCVQNATEIRHLSQIQCLNIGIPRVAVSVKTRKDDRQLQKSNETQQKTASVSERWVSRHFGPKTFRHHCDGAEVSGHFGTIIVCSQR